MKIIHLLTFYSPVVGGVTHYVESLSKEFLKQGHSVEVLCSNSLREGKIPKKKDIIEGVKITRYNSWFKISRFMRFFPGFFFDLLKKDFDVLHIHGYRHPHFLFGLLACKLRRKKCVITTHGPFHPRTGISKVIINFLDFFFGKILKQYDRVIGISSVEKKYFKKFGIKKSKYTIIPNGVLKEDFFKGDGNKFRKKYGFKNKEKIVLFVGRLDKIKNLKVLKYSVDNLKKIRFVFVGPDGGFEENYKEIFITNENVTFLGSVNHSDLKDIYSGSDLFVFPSSYESFGIVLLEAMAQGLPIISTNSGGPKDIVKKNFGNLINPFEEKKWFIEIKKFLKEGKKRKSNYSINEAKKYTWDIIAKKIIELYLPVSCSF